MERDAKERRKAIQEEVAKLPKEIREPMIWAIKHWDIVEWLCKEPDMTDEEIEALKLEAQEKKDYLLLILVCAAQVFKNRDNSANL